MSTRDKPEEGAVSLAPLTPEEALRALLKVQPDAPPAVYAVRAVPWEHGWELHVEGLGVTQVRSLDDAESQVRDYIETATGADPSTARIVVSPEEG